MYFTNSEAIKEHSKQLVDEFDYTNIFKAFRKKFKGFQNINAQLLVHKRFHNLNTVQTSDK